MTAPNDYRPVIIMARYPKFAVLTVDFRGQGFERSEGEKGSLLFSGSPISYDAQPGLAAGTYNLSVRGVKGPWSLQFAVPDPAAPAFQMFEEPIVGRYDNIAKVHLADESEIKWEMGSEAPRMEGHLVGFGDAAGTEQFLGIVQGPIGFAPGDYGFRSDGTMPAGDYLLVVDADGRWAITFSPIP
jgi:hypothetical protein